MKTFILIIFAVIVSKTIVAQEKQSKGEPQPELISFTAQFYSPDLYFNWVIKNVLHDGIFVIEKKENGIYVPVATKDAIGAGINLPILYSLVYKDYNLSEGFYRLRYFKVETGDSINIKESLLQGNEIQVKGKKLITTDIINKD